MLNGVNWATIAIDLDRDGYAILPKILSPDQCGAMTELYGQPDHFRSRVVMARHGFGQGEYQYFRYPLPAMLSTLRHEFYTGVRPIANAWRTKLGASQPEFPESHADYLARCAGSGQVRPTPLLLRYGPGDFNCLHQDLYGDQVFPLQMAALLSRPRADFTGGEFVLTEQRPRQQSRAHVVPLEQGDAVVFAVNSRPVAGARGYFRAAMRHGVSRVLTGQRHVLGVILHDAA